MLSARKQVALCIVLFSVTVAVVMLVLEHFDANTGTQTSSFLNESLARHFASIAIVFFATLISTSRHALLFCVDRWMKGSVSPFLVGLVNVFINITCLALFDFRIIHVTGSSNAMRTSILFADIASFMFEEATRTV